jgi:hypothetical protein
MSHTYKTRVFIDAHDDFPARERHHDSAEGAFTDAINRAENLATEEGKTIIGTATEGEVAEVFPEYGHGTVVIVRED